MYIPVMLEAEAVDFTGSGSGSASKSNRFRFQLRRIENKNLSNHSGNISTTKIFFCVFICTFPIYIHIIFIYIYYTVLW